MYILYPVIYQAVDDSCCGCCCLFRVYGFFCLQRGDTVMHIVAWHGLPLQVSQMLCTAGCKVNCKNKVLAPLCYGNCKLVNIRIIINVT